MIIRAIRLTIATALGPYGFFFEFSRHLTVVKGNNSSGKSTFFNTLLYSLGMEELVGGKGEKTLQYALKDSFYVGDDEKVLVDSSEVWTELENHKGDVVTLRRAIKDPRRGTKLIEIYEGACLTGQVEALDARPTYLHDGGSAIREEGFYSFLENFLGLQLPKVARTSGGDAKLYLQAIFAAHAVEQKRGWTDYIANIPFYGIRDARTRVAEYILGLGIFESILLRSQLDAAAVAINRDWTQLVGEIKRDVNELGVLVDGVPNQPVASFEPSSSRLLKLGDEATSGVDEYIKALLTEHAVLQAQADMKGPSTNALLLQKLEGADAEVQRLGVLHERATSNLLLERASLQEYESLLADVKGDLEKNKSARKLRDLGAQQGISIASGECPTCHQSVEDTLLREAVTGPEMDIDDNIAYLDSQRRMLERQIAGFDESIERSTSTISSIEKQLEVRRDHVAALRVDLGSSNLQSKAQVRRQVSIELEVGRLQRLEERFSQKAVQLAQLAALLRDNQAARRALPKDQYTDRDMERIRLFEKFFRSNAGSFGYESAQPADIKISFDNLVPTLADIELREIIEKPRPTADIRSDSSASDFVRLIWSYLLSLFETSSAPGAAGNHLGILLLDEPGQHSMREESQRALLLHLSKKNGLQSIVAASFEDSPVTFRNVTNNVSHTLISWEGKLIRPLG